ncbi:MAG TPA: hypothetical protein VLA44_01545 [Clostridia bacterium]|nr:hypothetical protein [Clostridia bacterium]
MSPRERTAKPKPARPWQRAEAGVYRSSDDRFAIASEGPSRWFITDDAERDELGLARTVGPYATLDDAKSAADARRAQAPEASPLAARIAGGGAKAGTNAGRRQSSAGRQKRELSPPPPPPKTWLDRLADDDRTAYRRAKRLIAALEGEGITDAEALVRRDLSGNQPAVATRLLAREILAAVGKATNAETVLDAILGALTTSRAGRGLPGWELVERDGPTGEARTIRLVPADLREADKRGASRSGD